MDNYSIFRQGTFQFNKPLLAMGIIIVGTGTMHPVMSGQVLRIIDKEAYAPPIKMPEERPPFPYKQPMELPVLPPLTGKMYITRSDRRNAKRKGKKK